MLLQRSETERSKWKEPPAILPPGYPTLVQHQASRCIKLWFQLKGLWHQGILSQMAHASQRLQVNHVWWPLMTKLPTHSLWSKVLGFPNTNRQPNEKSWHSRQRVPDQQMHANDSQPQGQPFKLATEHGLRWPQHSRDWCRGGRPRTDWLVALDVYQVILPGEGEWKRRSDDYDCNYKNEKSLRVNHAAFFGTVLCEFFLGDGAFSRTFNLLLNEPQDSRSNLLAVTSPRNHIQS